MRTYKLLPIIISLFEGGAASGGAAGGAAPAAGDGAQTGDATASRAAAGRGKTGGNSTATIRYGKQDAAGDSVQQQDAGAATSEEALRAEFLDLVNGKYKNAYTAETQKIIDKRFAAAKQAEAQMQSARPVLDMLMQRYGITNGDMQRLYDAVAGDDPQLAERAEQNGMTVEQQRAMDKLERDNRALIRAEQQRQQAARAQETTQKWLREADALRNGKYPNFDLRTEAANPEFLNLLRSGIPMEHAYEVIHRDEINRTIQTQTAQSTEKRVVDNIRAQGMRPRENGTASQGTFITKSDPRQLTKEDHKAIRERVRRGEKIRF